MGNFETEPNPFIRTTRVKIRDFLDYWEGHFRLQDLYEDLEAKTTEEKRAVRVGLSREKGITVEPTGSHGVWRKIDKKIDWFDLSEISQQRLHRLDMEMTLDIHKLVDFVDGDLIGLEAPKTHGKTAAALETGRRTLQYRSTVKYFSSEVTLAGIQDKARKDNIPLSSLKGLEYAYRKENFHDVIQPGALNIIDWLGPPTAGDEPKYFSIPHLLAKLHAKMEGKGLTLVCLQKDPGKKVGDGGSKIRHYMNFALTLDRDSQGQFWANIQECKVRPELVGYRMRYEPRPFELIPRSEWIPPK